MQDTEFSVNYGNSPLVSSYGSLESLAHLPLSDLLAIKGLGDVKIIRIAAALEIGRRTAQEILNKHAKKVKA